MKFEKKELKLSFEIDDVITVPMQLMYWGMIDEANGMAKFVMRWNAARILVKEWKFKPYPDPLAAFADKSDPAITAAIMWASQEVYDYITGLTEVPND